MTQESNNSNVAIAIAQMSMVDDAQANLNKALSYVTQAAQKGAQIVCLPELFRSLYFCNQEKTARDYSEDVDGEVSQTLSKAAADNKIVLVAGSLYEKHHPIGYNTALVFDSQGKSLGKYRKLHIPHDPSFFEQHYFLPGDLGYKIFETKINDRIVKIGVLICFDQWFPEAARCLALMGADIIFYPTAIGTVTGIPEKEGSWQEAWTTIQRGHAIANGVAVAAVNRVGQEDKSKFWGGSFVADAFGTLHCHGSDKEELLLATVDLDLNKYVKESWRFFHERRPDTYSKITELKVSK